MHTHVDTAILGAGFAGIGMGIRLDQHGRSDFLILERGSAVGGTWRDNTYPGAACDVPSHLYSFSFDLNPDWSHRFARQPEIRAYMERSVDRFGIRDRIRLGSDVRAARWDGALWQLTLGGGDTVSARVLVSGVGALRDPRLPSLPGIERFAGPSMHSARWDHSVDLRGLRVGVVGTGASAIQVVPALAPSVAALRVYQRTPPWVIKRSDRAFTAAEKAVLRHVPGALHAARLRQWLANEARYPFVFGPLNPVGRLGERVLKAELRRAVGPALADKVTPSYRLGCKRILLSDDWYPTLAQPHVHVETRAVAEVVPDGVVLADGQRDALDALIWCTGFAVTSPMGSLSVKGIDGIDLAETWGPRPKAYMGITVPRFPNFFLLLGPNTALGHSSVVIMIEAQIRYVLGALDHIDRTGPIDVRPEALDAFVAELDRRHSTRVWASGCDSWYLAAGANFTLWPGSTVRYLARTWRFEQAAYRPA